jgi:hypothetical protein
MGWRCRFRERGYLETGGLGDLENVIFGHPVTPSPRHPVTPLPVTPLPHSATIALVNSWILLCN